eukprot:Gb_34543 [translate_table: standard]
MKLTICRSNEFGTGIEQLLDRIIQRTQSLFHLFLVFLEPENRMDPLPHNSIILGQPLYCVNFRILLMQPVHLSFL